MAEQEKTPNEQLDLHAPAISHGEEFSEDYANNFSFEQNVWDFKMIFGQTDQMSGMPNDVNWHTAITMPWGVAKILSHMLILNITAYELQFGPIHIPPSVMPPEPTEPTGNLDTPATRILFKMQQELRRSLNSKEGLRIPIPVPATEPQE